jgi:glycosyltransferase involved in cell wall biosynthesis
MIYTVVQNFFSQGTVINGGSQSSRNLLMGLNSLGCSLSIISWSSTAENGLSDAPKIRFSECELGKIAAISLPPIQRWRDPEIVSLLRNILKQLPGEPSVFHLLEAKEYLGAWLAALGSTECKVVATALDYAWICATSHLLTRQSVQCSGPKDADSCLQCFYDHRERSKALALKLILASTYLPPSLSKMAPNSLSGVIRGASVKRSLTETRLESLSQDFQRVDALIAPSKVLKHFFIKNGLSADRVFHVPYGTQPGGKIGIQERPLLSEGVVFGFVGKLTFDKGLDLLIQALTAVRAEGLTSLQLIVYAGRDGSGFGNQVMELIDSSSWITLSQFNGRDTTSIDAAHRKIHFQVAPSRWTDNLPNAVLEGIERHTPIIAPDYGSFPEMIQQGVNGWLYPRNTVDELKKILLKVANAPEQYAHLPFDDSKTRLPLAEAEDVMNIYQNLIHVSEVR